MSDPVKNLIRLAARGQTVSVSGLRGKMSIEEWQSYIFSICLFKMLVGKQATQELLDVNSKQSGAPGVYILQICTPVEH